MRAEFESRFEAMRVSWYDTDEATFYANEGQDLPGASDILQATKGDRRKKADAGTETLMVRIDKDTDDENTIDESFITHEYSDSDVEPHAKGIKDKKNEAAAAKGFTRVKTTLSNRIMVVMISCVCPKGVEPRRA